jgi:hypothetical protein
MTSNITQLLRQPGQHLALHEISPLTDAVPAPAGPAQGNRRYPFDDMEVGDSFTLPQDRKRSMQSSVALFRRKFPARRFTWRTEGDRLRVWRTD